MASPRIETAGGYVEPTGDEQPGDVLSLDADLTPQWDAPGGSGLLQSVTVELSSAEILDLHNTPVQVIAAPGAGFLIAPLFDIMLYTFGTKKYPVAGPGFPAGLSYRWGTSGFLTDSKFGQILARATDGFSSAILTMGTDATATMENAAVSVKAVAPVNLGAIVTSAVGSGGADYAIGDTGTLDGAGTMDAEYVVDTVDGGGAVLTYHLSFPGTIYAVENGVTALPGPPQAGIGTGLTIDITEVEVGDGTLELTVYYVKKAV